VFGAIDKYYKVKKTRADALLAERETKAITTKELLDEAQADEALANAEKARAETEQIKAATRAGLEAVQVEESIRRDISRANLAGGTMSTITASGVGAKVAEAAIAELESNPAVSEVDVESN
jgi:hypothetical protein